MSIQTHIAKAIGGIGLLFVGYIAFVEACTNYPESAFEDFCRENMRVNVSDDDAWADYIQIIRIKDFEHRQEYPRDAQRWPNYVSLGHSYTEHYDRLNDYRLKSNYDPEPRRPYRNYYYIFKDGEKVATITNFDVRRSSIDYSGSISCLIYFPEVLEIPILSAEEHQRLTSSQESEHLG